MTQYSVLESVIAIGIMGGLCFLIRFSPFLLFSKHNNPPKVILYLGKVLPAAVMCMLVVYCLKDADFICYPFGIPEITALLSVILLHKWKRNYFISIFIPTALYMFMIQYLFI